MDRVQLDGSDVREYGSAAVHLVEAARLPADGEFRVHLGRFGPGGVLGEHPARQWQLLLVVAGSGWASGAGGDRCPLSEGQAVVWAPGEIHESGSDTGMTVLIVQSSARLPTGG